MDDFFPANLDPRFRWNEIVGSFRQANANAPGELPRLPYEQGRVIQRVASTARQDYRYVMFQ